MDWKEPKYLDPGPSDICIEDAGGGGCHRVPFRVQPHVETRGTKSLSFSQARQWKLQPLPTRLQSLLLCFSRKDMNSGSFLVCTTDPSTNQLLALVSLPLVSSSP